VNLLGSVIEHYVVVSSAIFTLGAVGFLIRRNMLVQLMCIHRAFAADRRGGERHFR
jgi:NADH:ubiquinone oxidoreductase subunit K